MSYASNHAAALASVRQRGTSLVFTGSGFPGENSDGTPAGAGAQTTVLAYGVEDVGGSPEEYARLGLIPGEAPRLFVVCDVYGDTPPIDGLCVWAGRTWQVRSVQPFRPDGLTIYAYVILSR